MDRRRILHLRWRGALSGLYDIGFLWARLILAGLCSPCRAPGGKRPDRLIDHRLLISSRLGEEVGQDAPRRLPFRCSDLRGVDRAGVLVRFNGDRHRRRLSSCAEDLLGFTKHIRRLLRDEVLMDIPLRHIIREPVGPLVRGARG